VKYSVEFLADTKGKAEIVDRYNCAELVVEYVRKEPILLELLHQVVVPIMGVGAVGNEPRVLDDLVVVGEGSGDFEWVVVEEVRRSIHLRKG
jgi:hypothetical protein